MGEGEVREETVPALADDGSAWKDRGVVRREAKEDLFDELGH